MATRTGKEASPEKSPRGGKRKPEKPRSEELKANLVKRLARIEGQVRGVTRMIGEDIYCDDILAQIAAARSALDAAALLLLEHHLRSCVAERLGSGDEGIVEELKKTIDRMLKS